MMHTDDETPLKKKSDKSHTSTENLTVSVEKHDTSKNSDKGDSEEPKPRIVLTFRSEKTSAKSSNMKIVSTEESTPRRSSRTRSKWEWICDSDPSASPKKDKVISLSENDESDSSYTPPRLRRRQSKDDVMANAIARKEKSYNESALGPTQRLSRRIKPTAKILANEELRIGLECQNNARLGLQTDKSPEEGVRTRRSARPVIDEKKEAGEVEVVEIDDDSQSQTSQVMKLKHLCELGLKAINPEAEDEESPNEKEDNEAEGLDDEEIDDDSEVISKLLEADEDTGVEDSDEDFYCSEEASQSERPRRSTRLCSSYGANDSDRSSPPPGDQEQKTKRRRSSRQAARHSYTDNYDRPKRKRNRSYDNEEAQSEGEQEETSNPAAGDEGAEAACPEGESTIVATCLCEKPDNVFAAPSELTEPVFCQAIELVDGIRVGCSHAARKESDGTYSALVRAGPRAPYFLACNLHTMQIRKHMCCPACGLFCSQGIFYQCSEGHLFHLECGLPYSEGKSRAGCPHCGVHSYRWQPANRDCCKVNVQLKCSNKRIFLPDQREQCTPAYLGFSTLDPSQLDHDPVIPDDLLPSVDVKQLFAQAKDNARDVTAKQLCDAILAGETVERLIPMIVSGVKVDETVQKLQLGTCGHACAASGRADVLHALALARADLDALDADMRTPLIKAVHLLLDNSETRSKEKIKDISKDSTEELETDQSKEDVDKVEVKDNKTEKIGESETPRPKDEDLMKVIRYLVAAGCDVNVSGREGMSALHVGAQHGSALVCGALLGAAGARVDLRDHGGWTPLVWAAENNHAHVVRLLLSHGADAASVDNEGNQAVHWCALAGAAASLHLLLHHAPHTLHAHNKHTDTPLHVAARQGHYACVVILLARGARTDIENSAGELPVEVCTGQCKTAILLNMQMKLALPEKFNRKRVLIGDISNGRELHPIPCVNEIDDAPAPDDFTYVTSHVMPAPLAIDNTIESLQGCECRAGECSGGTCACAVLSVRRWYCGGRVPPAFPFHDPPMLFECNHTCKCNAKSCGNRVVSNLSRHGSVGPLVQVFRAGGARGWGLRAGAAVPRGTAVALYCGELLTLAQADTRTKDYYMFALDVKPDLLEQCPDKTQLCVDAAQYGSAARFINHSCSPNLAPVRVFTDTRDLRLPTVTLFATKDIHLGEEFTFDYGDKFWSVKSKYMNCECGSIDCKYSTKSTEETES